jgi:DNA-binding IclR family transcriptional regulator
MADIERVRRTGTAYNHDESIVGAGSIAVGISNHDEELIAALGVVFPTHIVSDTDLVTLTPLVTAAANDISRRLRGVR